MEQLSGEQRDVHQYDKFPKPDLIIKKKDAQWQEICFQSNRDCIAFLVQLERASEQAQKQFDQELLQINQYFNYDLQPKLIMANYGPLYSLLAHHIDLTNPQLKILELGGGISPLLYWIKKQNTAARCISVDIVDYVDATKIQEVAGIELVHGDARMLDRLFPNQSDFNAVYSHLLLDSLYPRLDHQSRKLILEQSASLLRDVKGFSIHHASNDIVKTISAMPQLRDRCTDFNILRTINLRLVDSSVISFQAI